MCGSSWVEWLGTGASKMDKFCISLQEPLLLIVNNYLLIGLNTHLQNSNDNCQSPSSLHTQLILLQF